MIFPKESSIYIKTLLNNNMFLGYIGCLYIALVYCLSRVYIFFTHNDLWDVDYLKAALVSVFLIAIVFATKQLNFITLAKIQYVNSKVPMIYGMAFVIHVLRTLSYRVSVSRGNIDLTAGFLFTDRNSTLARQILDVDLKRGLVDVFCGTATLVVTVRRQKRPMYIGGLSKNGANQVYSGARKVASSFMSFGRQPDD